VQLFRFWLFLVALFLQISLVAVTTASVKVETVTTVRTVAQTGSVERHKPMILTALQSMIFTVHHLLLLVLLMTWISSQGLIAEAIFRFASALRFL
jgi:hypothetical protein